MKNILIVPNKGKDIDFALTKKVINKLITLGFFVYALYKHIGGSDLGISTFTDMREDTDLIVVIGGDGSVIDAAVYAISKDIPILGVNLGRVGYLAEVDPSNLEVFDRLVSGDYFVNEKMLLSSLAEGLDECVGDIRYAVNDIVFSYGGTLGISGIKIEDQQGNSVKYRVDGLIFSTPQGSTAYSLSSGGPILAHDVEGIVVTPVAPHSFFNRSVIFNSDEVISVTNVGEKPLNLCVDGRYYGKLNSGATYKVRKSPKKIKMIAFSKNSTFSNLFKKVRIMEDMD